MEIKVDYPKIRESSVCPICKNQKTIGLVICWDCYEKTQMRYGNPRIEAILDRLEDKNE